MIYFYIYQNKMLYLFYTIEINNKSSVRIRIIKYYLKFHIQHSYTILDEKLYFEQLHKKKKKNHIAIFTILNSIFFLNFSTSYSK